MAFDVWGVRGLYTSLGDGWTYLNANAHPQVPEKVVSAVARSFRTANVVAPPELAGSHVRQAPGETEGAACITAARAAVADLAGVRPAQVVLGPSLRVLYAALAQAMRPMLRRASSIVLSPLERPELAAQLERIPAEARRVHADLATGDVPAWQYREVADGSTRLVSLPAVHAELGNVLAVAEIAEAVRDVSRAWLLIDASGYLPYRSLDLEKLGADIAAVDLAQLGGPDVSALIFRDEAMFNRLDMSALELAVSPGLAGGVPAVVDHYAGLVEWGAGRASRSKKLKASMGELEAYLNGLRDDLHFYLGTLPAVHIVGVTGEAAADAKVDRVARLAFGVVGVPADTVQRRLLANGIVATRTPESPLLEEMGVAEMGGAVTVALAPFNTHGDIEQLVRTVASLA